MLKFADRQKDRQTGNWTDRQRLITIGHPPSGGALKIHKAVQ